MAAYSAIHINRSRLKKLRMRVEADTQFLPGSKKLKMRGRELDDLPPELFVMTDLEVLDLSPERQSCINYHLTDVPPSISHLTNLKVLMLDTNVIAQLPAAMVELEHLEKLSLSNNCLSYLPEGFEKLRSLQSLHLANNEFEAFPEAVCGLVNLYFLDICDNQLSELPDGIANLQKLESLFVFRNCLSVLPDTVCDLTELRSLWLGHNNIGRLPRTFSKLRRLDWGSRHMSSCVIDDNPLKHPPISVCKQGIAAIENYFQVAEPEIATPSQKNADDKARGNVNNKPKAGNKRESKVKEGT